MSRDKVRALGGVMIIAPPEEDDAVIWGRVLGALIRAREERGL